MCSTHTAREATYPPTLMPLLPTLSRIFASFPQTTHKSAPVELEEIIDITRIDAIRVALRTTRVLPPSLVLPHTSTVLYQRPVTHFQSKKAGSSPSSPTTPYLRAHYTTGPLPPSIVSPGTPARLCVERRGFSLSAPPSQPFIPAPPPPPPLTRVCLASLNSLSLSLSIS